MSHIPSTADILILIVFKNSVLSVSDADDEVEILTPTLTHHQPTTPMMRKPIAALGPQTIPSQSVVPPGQVSSIPTGTTSTPGPQRAKAATGSRPAPYGAQFRVGKDYKKKSTGPGGNPESVGGQALVFRAMDKPPRSRRRTPEGECVRFYTTPLSHDRPR